jgi:hypothetical protein
MAHETDHFARLDTDAYVAEDCAGGISEPHASQLDAALNHR